MSLIFSNSARSKTLKTNQLMYNIYTRFVKILEICKQFSKNLVNEFGNIPRRGPIPKFSDLEVVALALTAEAESIDSEKWLFEYKLQEYRMIFPISYQDDSLMTVEKRHPVCVRRYARELQ